MSAPRVRGEQQLPLPQATTERLPTPPGPKPRRWAAYLSVGVAHRADGVAQITMTYMVSGDNRVRTILLAEEDGAEGSLRQLSAQLRLAAQHVASTVSTDGELPS